MWEFTKSFGYNRYEIDSIGQYHDELKDRFGDGNVKYEIVEYHQHSEVHFYIKKQKEEFTKLRLIK